MPLSPGTTVAERFVIARVAGEGGMGVVYQAIDGLTQQRVALKLLHGRIAEDESRFVREGKLLGALHHPSIVRMIDRGSLATGEPYLAMEWLEGETLRERLERGPLSIDDAFAVAEQVAGALGVAHAAGVVHRDLKPANIFLVNGELSETRVLDFGIARAHRGTLLTMADHLLGTPGYMAPEQILSSDPVGPTADVYALGCVLFRCIAGVLPFDGESLQELVVRAASEDAPRLSSKVYVPAAVDDLVAAMLDRDPAARPANGETVAQLLQHRRVVEAATQPVARRGPPKWVIALLVVAPLVAIVGTLFIITRGNGVSKERTRADGRSSKRGKRKNGKKSRTGKRAKNLPEPYDPAKRAFGDYCMPPNICIRDVLEPPRMKMDVLQTRMFAALKKASGMDRAYVSSLILREVDAPSGTAGTMGTHMIISDGTLKMVVGFVTGPTVLMSIEHFEEVSSPSMSCSFETILTRALPRLGTSESVHFMANGVGKMWALNIRRKDGTQEDHRIKDDCDETR